MSGSIERVKQAADSAGLEIEIRRMGASTRTAEEAAQQCGCTVDQIVSKPRPARHIRRSWNRTSSATTGR